VVPEEAGCVRTDRSRPDDGSHTLRLSPPAADRAHAFPLRSAPLPRRARDRDARERCAALDCVRACDLSAFRAGEARAGDLGGWVSLAPAGAANAEGSV